MKRLKIQIKDSTDIAALEVDGLSIVEWLECEDTYEFKTEYKPDFLSGGKKYLFKLSKDHTPKENYALEIMDSGYWHPQGYSISIGEVRIRRLFYKRCIELINELEEYKSKIV